MEKSPDLARVDSFSIGRAVVSAWTRIRAGGSPEQSTRRGGFLRQGAGPRPSLPLGGEHFPDAFLCKGDGGRKTGVGLARNNKRFAPCARGLPAGSFGATLEEPWAANTRCGSPKAGRPGSPFPQQSSGACPLPRMAPFSHTMVTTINEAVEAVYSFNVGLVGQCASRHERPHKPVLLLAVLDLIARGEAAPSRIEWSKGLRERFALYFDVVRSPSHQLAPKSSSRARRHQIAASWSRKERER